ncbi:hypothetical protein C4D60_Mb07t19580 [Musa balbisiana]|uniref:Uncharacterized protein n=1 Tax=Musa balbisiana TaxID=52838 RepID=A0A4V4H6S8_MUSBA|nr:hypothetical protein C4D60_Mb07t19580 [Musa balbisiana]
MATLQAQSLIFSSSSSSPSGQRKLRASLHVPVNLRTKVVSLPKLNLGGLSLRQDDTATSLTQPPQANDSFRGRALGLQDSRDSRRRRR